MKTYLTVCQHFASEITLQKAAYLSAEDKQHFLAEYRDIMMRPVSDTLSLDHLKRDDLYTLLAGRKSIGQFYGSSNMIYEISQNEWDALVELNAKGEAAEEAKARSDEQAELIAQKESAERQMSDGRLPTAEEAKAKTKAWANTMNEGGDGYVPYYYTQEEYDEICRRLAELK